MKKMYMAPTVEISETMTCQMMALSIIQDEEADNSAVLTGEEKDWDIWSEE